MSNLRDILNEDSSAPSSDDKCDSFVNTSSTNGHSKTAASQNPVSSSLERMSLDFVAPGSRSTPNRASQGPDHSAGYTYYGYSADIKDLSYPSYSHQVQTLCPDPGAIASSQYSWTSINSMSNYRRPSAAGSTSYTEGESIDTSDHKSSYTKHQNFLSGSSKNDCAGTNRREARHAYGEEERAFIMVCAILRGMPWKKIEKEFRERFPAGQKRRHQEDGLQSTYPEQERTANGLTCVYYRIREQWGIPKVRGVPDEQKPEVKAVVKETILNMHDCSYLHKYAR